MAYSTWHNFSAGETLTAAVLMNAQVRDKFKRARKRFHVPPRVYRRFTGGPP